MEYLVAYNRVHVHPADTAAQGSVLLAHFAPTLLYYRVMYDIGVVAYSV